MDKLLSMFDNSNIAYLKDEPMAKHTTFRIGGNADYFVMPDSAEKLIAAVKALRECNIKYYVLGRGSNVLFNDDGYRGAVITTEKMKSITSTKTKITAECGAQLNSVAVFARDNNLAGLSFAYGIPGFVGGALFMNAGAYGGEMSNVVVKSTYYDADKDEIGEICGAEHKFGYRESIYREHPEWIILSCEIELEDGSFEIIKAEMDDYMERRRSKQPLEYPSAGSVFKRPEGYFAGALIEQSGLKGKTIGGASVSEKHAGFIINIGDASADDVLSLIEFIQATVRENFKVELECEMIRVK